jgi:L-fuconolactonase
MKKIIDSHLHCWDLEKHPYYWLQKDTTIEKRNYHIEEVVPDMKFAGITGAILIQSTNDLQEAEWLFRLAGCYEFILGAVVWLPLRKPDLVRDLAGLFLGNPFFKGVRHQIDAEDDDEWLLQSSVLKSLEILADYNIPYDVCGNKNAHIRTAINLVKEIPNLQIVLDHINNPPICKENMMPEWVDLMIEASEYKNIYAKVSGLGTFIRSKGQWNKESIKLYVKFVLDKFGIDRVLCGGDWPNSLPAGSYSYTWQQYISLFEELLSTDEQENVFCKNAERFYKVTHP